MSEYISAALLVLGILWLIYSAAFAAARGWKHGRGKVNAVEIHLHGRNWREADSDA